MNIAILTMHGFCRSQDSSEILRDANVAGEDNSESRGQRRKLRKRSDVDIGFVDVLSPTWKVTRLDGVCALAGDRPNESLRLHKDPVTVPVDETYKMIDKPKCELGSHGADRRKRLGPE